MFSVGNHESNHNAPGELFKSDDGGGECGVVSAAAS